MFKIAIFDNYIKKISGNWWVIFITGLLAVLLGISFIAWPIEALKVFAYFIGLIIIIVGLLYIKGSFKIKRAEKNYDDFKEKIKSKFE
jgi:uncharacterized membrane protein HdeD (DUF308 family)